MTTTLYDKKFYDTQKDGSFRSAELYLAYLWSLLPGIESVVDLGCGVGTWLRAAHELGAAKLVGYDGTWNRQANMIEPTIQFNPVDLNQSIAPTERFDLAISLEVAEHLAPAGSQRFVDSLTALADVVLFSAAYPGQGGTGHINERPHSDWAAMFAQHDYRVFDLFRGRFWDHPEIDTCYAQNAFLYVRAGCAEYPLLTARGFKALDGFAFMNCIHPKLYQVKVKRARSLRQKVEKPLPDLLRSLKKEFTRPARKLLDR